MRYLVIAGFLIVLAGAMPSCARACSCTGVKQLLSPEALPGGWPLIVEANSSEDLEAIEIRIATGSLVPFTIEWVDNGYEFHSCSTVVAMLWSHLEEGQVYQVVGRATRYSAEKILAEVTVGPPVPAPVPDGDRIDQSCERFASSQSARSSCEVFPYTERLKLTWTRCRNGPPTLLLVAGQISEDLTHPDLPNHWSQLFTMEQGGKLERVFGLGFDSAPPDRWELLTFDGVRHPLVPDGPPEQCNLTLWPESGTGECPLIPAIVEPTGDVPPDEWSGCSSIAWVPASPWAWVLLVVLVRTRSRGSGPG